MRTLAVESSWCIFYLVFQIITYGIFFFRIFFFVRYSQVLTTFYHKRNYCWMYCFAYVSKLYWGRFFFHLVVFVIAILVDLSFTPYLLNRMNFFFFFTRCNDLCGIFFKWAFSLKSSMFSEIIMLRKKIKLINLNRNLIEI